MMVGATPAPAAQDNPFGKEHSYLWYMRNILPQHPFGVTVWSIKTSACAADYLSKSYRKNASSLLYSLAAAQTPSHYLFLSPNPYFAFVATVIVPSDTQLGLFQRLSRILGKITRTQPYFLQ